MDVNSLQLFAQIVERGNLSAAARSLNMTRSNVSRRLSALEIAVGTPLIRRTTHSLVLTSAGETLYARARTIAREVEAAQAELCGRGALGRGRLRVALPRGVAQAGLLPVLLQFGREHPGVFLDVLFTNDVKDLHSERIDVAVRLGRQPIESAVVVCRSDVEQVVCASPLYLQSHRIPLVPTDLTDHPIITYVNRDGVIPLYVSKGAQSERVILTARFRANDLQFVCEAARAGLGIALMARYSVDAELSSNSLVELFPEYSFNLNQNKLYLQAMEVRYQTPPARLLLGRLRDAIMQLPLVRAEEERRAVA